MQILVLISFFLNFAITFDSDTLKNACFSFERFYFSIIDKFVYIKNVCLCIISMLKSEKLRELQNFVTYFSCILGKI